MIVEVPLGTLRLSGVAVLENLMVAALAQELARWQVERLNCVDAGAWHEHRAFVAAVIVTRIKTVVCQGLG